MKNITEIATGAARPIKVVQFGEGNFLRAFADYMIDIANEKGQFNGDIAVVKPIPFGSLDKFEAQKNLYTVSLRGIQGGNAVQENHMVTSISRIADPYADYGDYISLAELPELEFVISNTTEAGIAFDGNDSFDATPAATFPSKLTQFLHHRFQHFSGATDKGLVLLPVELIENNGQKLKKCVLDYIALWQLSTEFASWVETSCVFCSTLVDRIVTGYPAAEAEEIFQDLGYRDDLLVAAEPFGLWVIESEQDISRRFPLDKAGIPVVFTQDQRPYRERKVRILNGAHTATVLAAYLTGLDTVGECMADSLVRSFMEKAVLKEILPTVSLPKEEVEAFAAAVFERFENPYVRHELLSISLNSVSKWKSRILPSLKDSLGATGQLPLCLTFSFAALMAFYTSQTREDGKLVGSRNGQSYPIQDDGAVLDFFAAESSGETGDFVRAFAGRTDFWGEDLNNLPGFSEKVVELLSAIREKGMKATLEELMA